MELIFKGRDADEVSFTPGDSDNLPGYSAPKSGVLQ
jgi:hypothetical protein